MLPKVYVGLIQVGLYNQKNNGRFDVINTSNFLSPLSLYLSPLSLSLSPSPNLGSHLGHFR